MKKNIVALLTHIAIVTSVIITLGSLSLIKIDDEEEVSKFNGEIETNVKLRILENDTAKETGYLKELLDAFNEEYKEYGIEAVDANMDQYTDLETGGPYGYGPDVLYQANDSIMKYVNGRHILPLPVESLDCYSLTSEKAFDAYKEAGFTEDQAIAFIINDNLQLMKNLQNVSVKTEIKDSKNK